MTTGDAVGDVTHMIAQLMVAAPVSETKEDEEIVVTALDIALAESVTKTVSTYSAVSFSLSHPLRILFFFFCANIQTRGLVTIYAPSQSFISLQTITPTTRYPYPLSHVVIITAHYTHGSLVRSLTLNGMDLVNVTVVMILSPQGACHYYCYRVLMKHHVDISNEKDKPRHFTYEQY